MHHYSQLISIFNQCFLGDAGTELVRGGHEPVYYPRSQHYPWDRVIFAHGYYASALHEISHWCIAGDDRRRLVDFGYWYNPDGRTQDQQKEFEVVEVKPQAIEWILSRSCNHGFNVSLDNLNGDIHLAEQSARVFKENIWQQVQHYLQHGLPKRAHVFSQALLANYRHGEQLCLAEFKREDI